MYTEYIGPFMKLSQVASGSRSAGQVDVKSEEYIRYVSIFGSIYIVAGRDALF